MVVYHFYRRNIPLKFYRRNNIATIIGHKL